MRSRVCTRVIYLTSVVFLLLFYSLTSSRRRKAEKYSVAVTVKDSLDYKSFSGVYPEHRSNVKYASILQAKSTLKSIWDPCMGKSHSCLISPNITQGAYVLSLYDFMGSTIDDGRERRMDATTYYDYAYASIQRLRSLTSFPIILLILFDSFTTHRHLIQELQKFNINIEIIPKAFIDKHIIDTKGRQYREKHKYTYYNLFIFSEQFTVKYKALIFLDIDTFLLRNVDELFCMNTHFAAAERVRNRNSDFNSGVYLYKKKKGDFQNIMKEYRKYIISSDKEKLKRGIQAVLNRAFSFSKSCIPAGYNCGGFEGKFDSTSVHSVKCPFRGEAQLLSQVHPILHLKFSMSKYRSWLPTLSCIWRRHLPEHSKSNLVSLPEDDVKC